MQKPIYYALLFMIGLQSCQNEAEMLKKKYQEKIESELARQCRENMIFMDFMFGMSETAYWSKADELVSKGEFKRDYSKGISGKVMAYDVSLGQYDATATIVPGFYDGNLFKLFTVYRFTKIPHAGLTKIKLLILLDQKYGHEYVTLPCTDIARDEYDYYWIDCNREISLLTKNSEEVMVIYTDMIAEQQYEDSKAQERSAKAKEFGKNL